MATLVSRTIGSGGDYATIDLWIAAIPANLVTADEVWQGVMLDGTALSKSATTALASKTTDATRYIELTGQTPGAASLTNTGSAPVLDINVSFTRVSKIKLISTNNTTSAQPCLYVRSTCTNFDGHQLVCDGYGQNAALRGVAVVNGTTHYLRNSLLIQRSTDTAATIAQQGAGAKFINVTALALNATMAVGIQNATSAGTLKSVYVGGATAPEGASFPATKTTCATSATAAGWTTVAFSTANFVNLTTDFRPASGSALIDTGTNDATYAPTDVSGNARPAGSGTDIGAYEFQPASPNATAPGATLTGTASIVAGAASGGTAGTAPGASLTGTATIVAGAAIGGTASGVLTTRIQVYNTGTVRANETSVTVYIWNPTTGALVLKATGQTTTASGQVVVTNAALTPGTSYSYDVEFSDGGRKNIAKAAT